MPDLSLLFLSTLEIKQTGNIEFPYATIRKIIISNVKIKSEYIDFGKFKATGFTGSISLNTRRLFGRGSDMGLETGFYGAFIGFGYKTDLTPIRK